MPHHYAKYPSGSESDCKTAKIGSELGGANTKKTYVRQRSRACATDLISPFTNVLGCYSSCCKLIRNRRSWKRLLQIEIWGSCAYCHWNFAQLGVILFWCEFNHSPRRHRQDSIHTSTTAGIDVKYDWCTSRPVIRDVMLPCIWSRMWKLVRAETFYNESQFRPVNICPFMASL